LPLLLLVKLMMPKPYRDPARPTPPQDLPRPKF
jgi:hypothetical protein